MYKKYPKGLTLTEDKVALVEDNMGIAHKLASKWTNGVVPYEDLRQQAYLVLVDCATKFDPLNGNKFITYAYTCIDITLNNYVQNYNKLVTIPLNKIYKIHKYLSLPDEEKEEYQKSVKITHRDIEFYSSYQIISMDQQVVNDYEDCSDFYFIEDDGYDTIDNRLIINDVIRSLKKIIKDDFNRKVFTAVIKNNFEKEAFKDIAKEFGLKLKELDAIIKECQELMQKHKDKFV